MQTHVSSLTLPPLGWKHEFGTADGNSSPVPVAQQLCLLQDGHPPGNLIVQRTPDDVVTVSFAVDAGEPEETKQLVAAEQVLLQRALQIARKCKARYLRCLLPENESRHHHTALASCGFHLVTQIRQRERYSYARRHDPATDQPTAHTPLTLQTLVLPADRPAQNDRSGDTEDPTASGSHQKMLAQAGRMLDHIIAQSDDLPAVPPASGIQLLRLWSLLDSEISVHLALHGTSPVGVLVTSRHIAAEQPGCSSHTLEFVGVVSEWRRHQVASHLLNAMIAGFRTRNFHGPPKLTVYADVKNNAAQRFYDYHHFEAMGTFDLWICRTES